MFLGRVFSISGSAVHCIRSHLKETWMRNTWLTVKTVAPSSLPRCVAGPLGRVQESGPAQVSSPREAGSRCSWMLSTCRLTCFLATVLPATSKYPQPEQTSSPHGFVEGSNPPCTFSKLRDTRYADESPWDDCCKYLISSLNKQENLRRGRKIERNADPSLGYVSHKYLPRGRECSFLNEKYKETLDFSLASRNTVMISIILKTQTWKRRIWGSKRDRRWFGLPLAGMAGG